MIYSIAHLGLKNVLRIRMQFYILCQYKPKQSIKKFTQPDIEISSPNFNNLFMFGLSNLSSE